MPTDLTQIILSITLLVTTVFLVLIGLQVIKLLKQLRVMLGRVDSMVEGFERMGTSVEGGFNEVVGFFGGLRSVMKIMEFFNSRKNERRTTSE
jgi:hypothetical protein